MSSARQSIRSGISLEIDDRTVRKHGSHDGEFDVDYERLVGLAVDEVGTAKWEGDE